MSYYYKWKEIALARDIEVLDMSKLTWVKQLGDPGSFGYCYLANWKRSDKQDMKVCVKFLGDHDDPDYAAHTFVEEINRYQNLEYDPHPNLCRFFGAHPGNYNFKQRPAIMIEYVTGQTLEAVLLRYGKEMTDLHRLHILWQLGSALQHLHRRNVVHRDLKPANIMIDTRTNLLKLIDLGFARTFEFDYKTNTILNCATNHPWAGSKNYQAPCQFKWSDDYKSNGGWGEVRVAADVFAFGVILIEMWHGFNEWQSLSKKDLMEKYRRSESRSIPAALKEISPKLYQLAVDCTRGQQKLRPTIDAVMRTLYEVLEEIAAKKTEGPKSENKTTVKSDGVDRKDYDNKAKSTNKHATPDIFKDLKPLSLLFGEADRSKSLNGLISTQRGLLIGPGSTYGDKVSQDYLDQCLQMACELWLDNNNAEDARISQEQFTQINHVYLKSKGLLGARTYLRNLDEGALGDLYHLYASSVTGAGMPLSQFCHAWLYLNRENIEDEAKQVPLCAAAQLIYSTLFKDTLIPPEQGLSDEWKQMFAEVKTAPALPDGGVVWSQEQSIPLRHDAERVLTENPNIFYMLRLGAGRVEVIGGKRMSYGLNLILSYRSKHESGKFIHQPLVCSTPDMVAGTEQAYYYPGKGEKKYLHLGFLGDLLKEVAASGLDPVKPGTGQGQGSTDTNDDGPATQEQPYKRPQYVTTGPPKSSDQQQPKTEDQGKKARYITKPRPAGSN